VISGGAPEGEAAFRELSSLGVQTIVSVDGARPDLALAEKHGMRYVHIPHGYDGISEERGIELAKAVRDLPGPIYIHCHHGKHRSPAAAAVACVGAGLLPPDAALAVLRTAGTSDHYLGLYQAALRARRIDDSVMDAADAEFPATAELPPMAKAMVAIEHVYDRLKAIERAGWTTPAEEPDLDPPHEALLLREQFTELLRADGARQASRPFRDWLRESESSALELEDALRGNPKGRAADAATVSRVFGKITQHCTKCHAEFRDRPRNERGG
jgi:hypothetical protein